MGLGDGLVTMARAVVVRVLGVFTYAEHAVRPGDWIVMSPLDAAAAHRHGLVSLTRGPVGVPTNGAADEITPPEPSAPARRRRYRRRDLEPER